MNRGFLLALYGVRYRASIQDGALRKGSEMRNRLVSRDRSASSVSNQEGFEPFHGRVKPRGGQIRFVLRGCHKKSPFGKPKGLVLLFLKMVAVQGFEPRTLRI
jgi:hypothetical protein